MTTRITGGRDRGRRIRIPAKAGLRPTSERVRAAIFSMIGAGAVVDKRVLDLYAGTGVLALEALSRGAESAVFVEDNGRRCEEIRRLLGEFGMDEKGQVRRGKVERVLGQMDDRFDLVFADPPYDNDPWETVMLMLNERDLLRDCAFVVAEHRHDRRLSDGYGGLTLATNRRHGDTAISIYRFMKTDG